MWGGPQVTFRNGTVFIEGDKFANSALHSECIDLSTLGSERNRTIFEPPTRTPPALSRAGLVVERSERSKDEPMRRSIHLERRSEVR